MKIEEVLEVLRKRKDRLEITYKKEVLLRAYEIVINDLIDSTDSCTGELET